MASVQFVVLLVAALLGTAVAGPLAAVWIQCPKDDPGKDDCFMKATKKIMAALIPGIPQLNLPGLDPLLPPDMTVSAQGFNFAFKNTKVRNLFQGSDVIVAEAKPDEYYMHWTLKNPNVICEGNYDVGGSFLNMPLSGAGNFELVLGQSTIDATIKGKAKAKNGKNYMDIVDLRMTINPETFKANATNLFNGNAELSEKFLGVVNDNWVEIYGEAKEKWWAGLSAFFKHALSNLFDNVPYDEIFKS